MNIDWKHVAFLKAGELKPLKPDVEITEDTSAEKKSSQWIKCSERMPDENGAYAVYCRASMLGEGYVDYVDASFYVSEFDMWDGELGEFITHWMPLPKPPEDE